MKATKQAKLNEHLLEHDFEFSHESKQKYSVAKLLAKHYADAENAITVLSNMSHNISFICYGQLGALLGLGHECEEVQSIWEKKILDHIHPDDVAEKIAWELQFLSFIKQASANIRANYYLQHYLRIKCKNETYTTLRHRIYYLDYDSEGNVLLTLCIYTASNEQQAVAGIYNSLSDSRVNLTHKFSQGILSERECEILQLIGQGMASKQIANNLCISINTVNNHRQNIMRKLHCQNTTAAVGVARSLGLFCKE